METRRAARVPSRTARSACVRRAGGTRRRRSARDRYRVGRASGGALVRSGFQRFLDESLDGVDCGDAALVGDLLQGLELTGREGDGELERRVLVGRETLSVEAHRLVRTDVVGLVVHGYMMPGQPAAR